MSWTHRLCLLALVAACTDGQGAEGDAAPAADSAPPLPCTTFAETTECTTFIDATSSASRRFLNFEDFDYRPKCLQILSGQSVLFLGDFREHPFEQACGPAAIERTATEDLWATFEFATTGLYGYYCTIHGQPSGSGMAGAIDVSAAPDEGSGVDGAAPP